MSLGLAVRGTIDCYRGKRLNPLKFAFEVTNVPYYFPFQKSSLRLLSNASYKSQIDNRDLSIWDLYKSCINHFY